MVGVDDDAPDLGNPHAWACRKLWLNVLIVAVADALGQAGRWPGTDAHVRALKRADAKNWLLGNHRDFYAVCDYAGVDATWLRRLCRQVHAAGAMVGYPQRSRETQVHHATAKTPEERARQDAERLASKKRRALMRALQYRARAAAQRKARMAGIKK